MEKVTDTPEPATDDRDLASEYSLMHNRVKELVAALVRRKFVGVAQDDPRPAFLMDLEVGRITARVELTAYVRLLIDLLEVPTSKVLAYINEELGAELNRLEEEVGDTAAPGSN